MNDSNLKKTVGRVHSIETFGTVDGPGIRYVVFLQGCPLRCQYCHNPDSWTVNGGTIMTVEEVLAGLLRNQDFYDSGGLTVSGGEPLLQIDFLLALFTAAKQHGIHTCMDTSGVTYQSPAPEAPTDKSPSSMNISGVNTSTPNPSSAKLEQLLTVTDLVLLDIKHIDSSQHHTLTGKPNDNILQFAHFLERRNIPVWIRHVVVPGLTDHPDDLYKLGAFIGSLKNVTALDVLPYHDMGKPKYEQLKIPYVLADTPPLTEEGAAAAREIILRGISDEKTFRMP